MRKTPGPEQALLDGQLELIRPPAPGRLELVRSFLNTAELQPGTDELTTAEGFAAWAREQGLIARRTAFKATPDQLAYARAIREELRALARRNNGVDCTCSLEQLQAASARSAYAMTFDPAGSARLHATAPGVDGVIGTILAAVHAAMADRSWHRLKACADDTCAWAYYDHSKNGCSRWCSPETCGNRDKVKRYRERKARIEAPT